MDAEIPPLAPSQFSTGGQHTNTLAIISLGLGLAGFPFLCMSLVLGVCGCVEALLAIAAVITGFMAHSQIQTSGESGSGMALAGMIIGGVQVVLVICATLFFLVLALASVIMSLFNQ